MASRCMVKISLVLPWKNLYGGPLNPRKYIRCCKRVGAHHSLWNILIRATKRRDTHTDPETRIIKSLVVVIFLDKFLIAIID